MVIGGGVILGETGVTTASVIVERYRLLKKDSKVTGNGLIDNT